MASASQSFDWKTEVAAYGVSRHALREFLGSGSPELLNYLDLVKAHRSNELLPDGVAENQGRPLLFLLNESRLAQPNSEQEFRYDKLRRSLASRGDRAYLARVRPGELLVVPVALEDQTADWLRYEAGTWKAETFFSRLALGQYDGPGDTTQVDFVFAEMYQLLEHVADALAKKLQRQDVLSLVGRALFFRFLLERQVVTDQDTHKIARNAQGLLDCFTTAENAASSCDWLDRTFNGDFLPLTDGGSLSFFEESARISSETLFHHLTAIIRGDEPVGADVYQGKLNWGDFDFAHVPVGLLSQVYEAFCWKWEPHDAKETSVHYTPRNIAATLVDEAFDGLANSHRCRVLDPACGAGIFLVLAFRRLYRERWQATGERPDTKTIRQILRRQLVGFDISDSALKLCALGLYLTAIELDPDPVPAEKLKFTRLRENVLFNFRRPGTDPETGPVIGSLGPHVGKRFDHRFHLVLSNPPWTSLPERAKELAAELTSVSKEIICRKGEFEFARKYRNPDNAPDLPLFWKSTEWCKKDGRIAMALPARILLKQEDLPTRARETLFRLVEVTGIINGSNLADTKVWPEMNQPFMLFFARQTRPKPNHVVRFITLHHDSQLNQRGEVRIDSKSVLSVEMEATFSDRWLWKALAVGTGLDADVIRRIRARNCRPLEVYWEKDLGLHSSNGYQVKEKQKQWDATFMQELKDLNSTDLFKFQVDPQQLALFSRATLARPRNRDVYRQPLVLIKVAPGELREDGRALLAFTDLAYNESFYGYSGYSATGYADGELAVRYIHLFIHSLIWSHYTLLTSPEFGAERRKFQKKDLDNCPVVPLTALCPLQRQAIFELSNRLVSNDLSVFSDIDAFFADLYQLDKLDLEVIRETLAVELPFDEPRRRACAPPNNKEREAFCRRLQHLLRPFFKMLNVDPQVKYWTPENAEKAIPAPFGVLVISAAEPRLVSATKLFAEELLQMANETGATLIIHQIDGGVLVGILNQYRYWTPSRARLLAGEIVRSHLKVFEE